MFSIVNFVKCNKSFEFFLIPINRCLVSLCLEFHLIICFNQLGYSFAWTRIYSGAPARAKRAWDRAPYSWNMVNLFSFGCHVIDRAYVHMYVRVYRLCGWGRGDYQKEGRGVSGVSWQVHIFNIGF